MRADYLSYRRATTVSLIGLALQVLMAGLLFAYAFLRKDHAATTVSLYAAVGLVVWLALAILFDQHRRERIEAFEAEALAQAAGSSSVFEQSGDDLRVAAKRLRAMQKVFLPAVSIVVGGLLIAGGIVRFLSGKNLASPDRFRHPQDPGFVLFVTVAAAIIGFVFARFVSGMAKQPIWKTLGAGATWAVGTSLLSLLIAIGHFVDIAGPDTMLRYLQPAIPIIMIVLGVEVFLNLLLEVYRPRRQGEVPRVSFDSRLLGLAAAPDRVAETIGEAINYQFGSNVTSSWFYRLFSRWFGALVLIGIVVAWLLTSVAVVQPHQRGILLRFGSVVREDVGPGLHIKAPWPIDRIVIPEYVERDAKGIERRRVNTASGVRELQLGTAPPSLESRAPILWTTEHVIDEQFSIVLASDAERRAAAEDSADFVPEANDFALVALEVPLQYVVEDAMLYEQMGAPEMRDRIIEAVGRRAVMRYLARHTSDQLMGGDRRRLADDLRADVQAELDALNPDADGKPRGCGIRVLFVGAAGAHPPKKAALPFERVVQAEQRRIARLKTAEQSRVTSLTEVVGSVDRASDIFAEIQTYEAMRGSKAPAEELALQASKIEDLLAQAGGSAAKILAEARADRWTRLMSAQAAAARYQGQIEAFNAAPTVYQSMLYFDAVKSLMEQARVYIVDDGVDLRIRAELQDVQTGQNVFNPGSTQDGQ